MFEWCQRRAYTHWLIWTGGPIYLPGCTVVGSHKPRSHRSTTGRCAAAEWDTVYGIRTHLETGELPRNWKESVVPPIHKHDGKNYPQNYRPINLTSLCCKVTERLLRKRVCGFRLQNSLNKPQQHGFLLGRLCLSNLRNFLDEVTERLDSGKSV